MARADLLCELIKSGLAKDEVNFRKAAEAICVEENQKQHKILAKKIEELLKAPSRSSRVAKEHFIFNNASKSSNLYYEKIPERRLDQLILPDNVQQQCKELIEEQTRADLLRSYGLEPRNKILLIGPPGNGKTSLAEAIAESAMVPLYTVKYESIVGAYLGETTSKLVQLFEHVKTRPCVLFFDEFETLGKERGDQHETGEIKRVVSSLLLQIDALPSYVIIIAATNHETLLDKAAWRRFQLKLTLPPPSRKNLELWFSQFEKRTNFKFGFSASTLAKRLYSVSYAEAEEFSMSVYRKFILRQPTDDVKVLTSSQLKLFQSNARESIINDNDKNNVSGGEI